MIALLSVIPAIAVALVAGWGIDRAGSLRFERLGLAAWPVRAFATVAAVLLFSIHPALLLLAAGALVVARRVPSARAHRAPLNVEPFDLAAVAIVTLVAMLRPHAPIYWDEFVWLWKSRIAQTHWNALRDAALTPDAIVIPRGYVLLWSQLPAWLAAPFAIAPLTFTASIASCGAAAIWLSFVGIVAREIDARARGAVLIAALALVTTPFLLVHLRSAYADLTIGFLVAAIALALASRTIPIAVTCVLAIVATGAKDEGLAHIVAVVFVAGAIALRDRQREGALRAAVPLAAAAVPFVAWRVLLRAHHMGPTQHRFDACAFREAPPLVTALAEHAFDLTTWGMLWPLAIGVSIALGSRRDTRRSPESTLALTAAAQLGILFAGLTCGNASDREFAFDGSLLNRAFVQIAPMTVAMLAIVLSRRFTEARGEQSTATS